MKKLYDQTEKKNKELCRRIRDEFEKRAEERMQFQLQWQLNINFFLGNQYCDILPEAGKIYQQDKVFLWQEREVYNHIAPIIDSRLAKLNKINPRVLVRPATNDEEDIQSAKVSTEILNSAFEKTKINEAIAQGNMWSEICGTVFYKQDWVNEKGVVLGKNQNGENISMGDVSISVCPPYEIYPDSNYVQDISFCESVIHAHIYSCADIKRIWGKEVEPMDVHSLAFDGMSLSGGFGQRAYTGALKDKTSKQSAVVLEYYKKPDKDYENGQYIVVCGSELLYRGDLPYINGENKTRKLPFAQQNSSQRPGCLWGISVVERCIPIQRSYNAVRNRKHEFLNRAAVGILAVEEGTVDVEELQENGLAPGKVIVYRQGANPPQMMHSDSIPSEFDREENTLVEEFNMISGTSDLMKQSIVPTNITSGTALNALAQQDDTRISVTADKIREAIIEISKQWLRLYKQFASQMRIDRITGENGETARIFWSNNMLTSDDVVHETENELSSSIASRKQLIFDLLSRGLFNDENGNISSRTRERILRAIGAGDWENIQDLCQIHSARAMRENLLLKNGGFVKVLDSDDHEIHISEHQKVLLSGEFEDQYGIDSETYRRFEEHIAQHRAKKEEQYSGGSDAGTLREDSNA